MRIYISGPMSGIPDFNYPAFHKAKEQLEMVGYNVLSPADIPITDGWEWLDYILLDIDSVFAAEGVATLPNCELSKGSRIECKIADLRGLQVRPLKDWLP